MLAISEHPHLMRRGFCCSSRLVSATSAALVSQGRLARVFSRLEGPDDHHCDAAWAAQPCHHAEPGGHGDRPAPAGGTADADAGTAGNF